MHLRGALRSFPLFFPFPIDTENWKVFNGMVEFQLVILYQNTIYHNNIIPYCKF